MLARSVRIEEIDKGATRDSEMKLIRDTRPFHTRGPKEGSEKAYHAERIPSSLSDEEFVKKYAIKL